MESYILDPTNDPYAAKIDYKDSRKMVGANYSSGATYLYTPMHHYGAIPIDYSRPRLCEFVLRLTNATSGSVGQVTHNVKQSVAFGFTTDFSFQFLHLSVNCLSIVCADKY